MEIYVVRQGDQIDEIAGKYGIPAAPVIYQNQLVPPYRLAVGQALLIPTENGEADRKKPEIFSNGYAYPFISRWTLRETLPFLSELSVFSYGFSEDGELIPPAADDQWIIEEALSFQTIPTLTLTPLGADGRFNNQLITKLLSDEAAKKNIIRNLIRVILQKRYRGLNLDFEYILPEDRVAYAAFVKQVTDTLNLFEVHVSVALAPKYSDQQSGVLYEGMDYALLGAAANSVFLMTYEWGYTYGEPMAVAPVNQVRRVAEYALTRIPAEKVVLGVPNYGYDWPLPFQAGTTRAKTLGNIEAVSLAGQYGAEIQFDEQAQSPWFRYWQYGIQHEVWFQDVRSYRATFELAKELGLRGVGYWTIMQLFRANWTLLADMFSIQKGI